MLLALAGASCGGGNKNGGIDDAAGISDIGTIGDISTPVAEAPKLAIAAGTVTVLYGHAATIKVTAERTDYTVSVSPSGPGLECVKDGAGATCTATAAGTYKVTVTSTQDASVKAEAEVEVPAVAMGPGGDAKAVQGRYCADETAGRLEFNAAEVWTVKGPAGGALPSWLVVSPASGGAGDQNLTVKLAVNRTGADREAVVEVTSGGVTVAVVIEQAHTTEDGAPFGGAVSLAISPKVVAVEVDRKQAFSVTAESTGYTVLVSPSGAGLGCVKDGAGATCTATAPGTYTVTVTAAEDLTVVKTATLTAFRLGVSPATETAKLGQRKVFTVTPEYTGFEHPVVTPATGATCSVSGNSVECSGTAPGTYAVTVKATEDLTVAKAATLTVEPSTLELADDPGYDIPTMVVGEAVTPVTVGAATGGVPPYTYSATGLPAGLEIDPATGEVTGAPTALAAAGAVQVTVTDGAGNSAAIEVGCGAVTLVGMVPVAGGTFTMGCTAEQGDDCYSNEYLAHAVTLSGFSMGKYEVTQAQWKAVMGGNPSAFTGADRERRPVEQVSWNDIVGNSGSGACMAMEDAEAKGVTYYEDGFVCKLNKLEAVAGTGRVYRLPTEAEWEYAARGGASASNPNHKYSGGDNAVDVAWYVVNSDKVAHEVGTKPGNELGIHDMSGNVYEWASDWYGAYSGDAQTDPTGPVSGSNRVIRSGSWGLGARFARVSYRGGAAPGYRSEALGFRLASGSQ
jgi:formylglycine-generating enzyme required for sulfatase activity